MHKTKKESNLDDENKKRVIPIWVPRLVRHLTHVSMSRIVAFNIVKLVDSYTNWVANNPTKVADVETAIKYASYFIAGRLSSSTVVSELIYSLSNLLVLFNDRIIEKSNLPSDRIRDGTESFLVLLLTRLEYCEVFIELSCKKVWGEAGRWFVIVVIQLIKCLGRLILTLHYRNSIVQSPPVSVLDRKTFDTKNPSMTNINKNGQNILPVNGDGDGLIRETFNSRVTFTLRRSGRVVRKVEGAQPLYLRNWKQIGKECKPNSQTCGRSELTTAETLYILKPIIHLSGCALFGYKSWRSWLIAVIIDFMSLRIYLKNRSKLTKIQKVEISRRIISIVLYLLRSPFYDRCSRDKINALLNTLIKHIPFTKGVVGSLRDYIPYWQDTYFHMWS